MSLQLRRLATSAPG